MRLRSVMSPRGRFTEPDSVLGAAPDGAQLALEPVSASLP